jgi:hypothetical protein
MAIDRHFQIEKPRKIQISIPGYDPILEIQKISKRSKRLRERNARKAAQAAQERRMRQLDELMAQDEAIADLNRSTAAAQAQTQAAKANVAGDLFNVS